MKIIMKIVMKYVNLINDLTFLMKEYTVFTLLDKLNIWKKGNIIKGYMKLTERLYQIIKEILLILL